MRLVAVPAAAVLCATAFGWFVFAADTKDAKEVNLSGAAVWNGNHKTAVVKAVLTPTGDKTYDAVWTFTWEKSSNTWKGTVKGDLKNGVVTGTGATPDGKRTFIFQARAVNGVITGQHWETTGGKQKLTGDLQFKVTS
jgi:hypothetical protein